MQTRKKVLIIVSGGTGRLEPFRPFANKMGIELTLASFSQLEYFIEQGKKFKLLVAGKDIATFDVVYIRLAGQRGEDAALLANYASDKGVQVVDRLYVQNGFTNCLPIPKSLEAKLLFDAGIPLPKTIFGSLEEIRSKGPQLLGFPFVIKDTAGKRSRGVWSPKTREELESLINEIKQHKNKRFIAQELTKAGQRYRVLVIGGQAIAEITRPTIWRVRFLEKVNGSVPPGERRAVFPISKDDADLAIKAASTLAIDIAGVDILKEEKTGKRYVLEVNSAPRWDSIKHDAGVNVEEEILKYLVSL